MKKIFAFLISALLMFPVFCVPVRAENRERAFLEEYPVGDVNFDGVLQAEDARTVLRASVGLESLSSCEMKFADTDCDGRVLASDARAVLRSSVGLEAAHCHNLVEPKSKNAVYVCRSCEFTCPVDSVQPLGVSVKIGDKTLRLGEDISRVTRNFGMYSRTDGIFSGMSAYSFTEDYSRYFMAFCAKGRVVGAYVLALSFSCEGIENGDVFAEYKKTRYECIVPFSDGVHSGGVYALLVYDDGFFPVADTSKSDFTQCVSREIFDMTNAYRVMNGQKALTWNESVARVTAAHSTDMAKRRFFDHVNPDGENPWDRAEKAGIKYYYYGENIAAGNPHSFNTFDQWVNSPPHNEGMLSFYPTEIGVGGACVPGSEFRFYWTQNFI